MALRITSKRDGFRRCGVAHSATPTEHPAGRFTEEEVERLKAEPMLIVEEIPDEAEEEIPHPRKDPDKNPGAAAELAAGAAGPAPARGRKRDGE
jgi:hypothetical protein